MQLLLRQYLTEPILFIAHALGGMLLLIMYVALSSYRLVTLKFLNYSSSLEFRSFFEGIEQIFLQIFCKMSAIGFCCHFQL